MTTKDVAMLKSTTIEHVSNAIRAGHIKARKVKARNAVGYVYDVYESSLNKWHPKPHLKRGVLAQDDWGVPVKSPNGSTTIEHDALAAAVSVLRLKRNAIDDAIKALESVK